MSFFLNLLKSGGGAMVIAFLLGIVIPFIFLPRSARTRFKAKFAKSGVLVTLVYDDGFEQDELMKADFDGGIFTKGKDTVIWTPNPVYVEEEVGEGEEKKTKTSLDISTDHKKIIDEAILHRSITDTGKAHYTCLAGKMIAVTPALLGLIKTVNDKADETRVRLGTLIEPQILKSYIPNSFNQQTIKNIKAREWLRGRNAQPAKDFLDEHKISIVFILLIGIFGYLIITGKLDLTRIFGSVLPSEGV